MVLLGFYFRLKGRDFSKYDEAKGADADYKVWKDMPESNPLKRIMREKYKNDEDTLKTLDVFQVEIEMFRKYSSYYGYTFFIMRK